MRYPEKLGGLLPLDPHGTWGLFFGYAGRRHAPAPGPLLIGSATANWPLSFLNRIRGRSTRTRLDMAALVMRMAFEEGLAGVDSPGRIDAFVRGLTYRPVYPSHA